MFRKKNNNYKKKKYSPRDGRTERLGMTIPSYIKDFMREEYNITKESYTHQFVKLIIKDMKQKNRLPKEIEDAHIRFCLKMKRKKFYAESLQVKNTDEIMYSVCKEMYCRRGKINIDWMREAINIELECFEAMKPQYKSMWIEVLDEFRLLMDKPETLKAYITQMEKKIYKDISNNDYINDRNR